MDERINQLTLKEKINLCTGKSMWSTKDLGDLKGIILSDGPHGLRYQRNAGDHLGLNDSYPSTCFPVATTMAQTFNPTLIEEVGKAIGLEALHYGVSCVLGPGCNIKRNPLGGRNFEYYSEDPYVSGMMASSFIRGLENQGVMASLKHFACNNQEYKRQNGNSILDERTLREIYLKPFEIAIKNANPSTIMCSYNQINGIYASDHIHLLKEILREEWKYKGLVITDWGAMHDRVEAFQAGCDLNMPGGNKYGYKQTLKAIQQGKLDESYIDDSVKRIINFIQKGNANKKEIDVDFEKHHHLSYQIACEGAVLLQNQDGILPLNKDDDYCILGYMANHIRYQGSGSSHMNPTKLIQLIDLFPNIEIADCLNEQGDLVDLDSGIQLSKKHDKVVILVGSPDSYESEAFDRIHMSLPSGMNQLIEEIVKVNSNVIVVLLSGGVVELPWKDKVKGILYMGLAGQASANAIKDLLMGNINPSGKLTETWPICYQDVMNKDCFKVRDVEYREGIYVGYRHYDKVEKAVAYPFGYGLSYSQFHYSDIKLEGNKVSFMLENQSEIAGKEIVQLYIAPYDDSYKEVKQLKGFKKIHLDAKESKTIEFELTDDMFIVYLNKWIKAGGKYQILIGSSSRDIKLKADYQVEGENIDFSLNHPVVYKDLDHFPNQEEFKKLLGKEIKGSIIQKGSYTLDHTILEMKEDSKLMKVFYYFVTYFISTGFKKEERNMNNASYKMMINAAIDCPLRAMVINAGGMLPERVARMLVDLANGHYILAFKTLILG